MSTLLVAGSRSFASYKDDDLFHMFNSMADVLGVQGFHTVVISGGAPGVDRAAERWANFLTCKFYEFPADWERYGKSAGFWRNVDMVEACDCAILLYDGYSHGTGHTIELLRDAKKPFVLTTIYSE